MKRVAWCVLALVVAGCGGTKTVTSTVTVDSTEKRGVGAPLVQVLFGQIASLRPKGDAYELLVQSLDQQYRP